MTASQSEIDAPVTSEEVRQFLASMQKLNASLQQLLQNMGNANYDVNSNEILENMTNISRNTSISEEFKIDTDKNIKPSKAKHSKKRSNSVKKKKTPSLWQYDEDKSLRDDVKLYVVSCAVKVDDFSNEDWKSISKMHNENFWKDTKYKGRSYKDLKSQYNKPPLTASDTSKDDMNGEIEEISASDNNNHNNNIPIIKSTSNDDDDDDSSSDDEDALSGLLNAMQAPPQ